MGAAYGIGGLKSDNTPTKKVWKIVSYPSAGVINYNNAFYCIKAEHGFASNTGSGDVSSIRKTYDTSFNMKTQKNEVITRLNTINNNIGDPTLSDESYNKIMWIIDNMYLPKSATAAQDKQKLMEAAEIIGENGYESGLQLTDDDIEVVQQLALWYFTNANDSNYHQNGSDSQAILQTLLFNDWNGTDSGYRNFADLYDDRVLDTRLGTDRQNQAEDLYRYFINNAKGNYNSSQTVTSPITLNKSNYTATQVGEKYIIGPLSISVDKTKDYNITQAVFKDQNGNTISLTGENKLLNSNKEPISDNTIKLGEEFYLSLPITTNITKVGFEIRGTYKITSATYYTTSQNTYAGEQPVVLVEKANENYRDNIEVGLPAPRYLDLALRKSITKINNAAPSVNRLPRVDASKLIPNGTDKTAKYNHPKNALTVETNQFIEYTITVYNEGGKDGYAKEIKDYLPAGIEFVELVTPKDKYTANSVKNADGTSVVTITNTNKTVLGRYTSGTPKNESFTIKCKVTKKATTEDQVLVNIAEITKYYDSESGIEITQDRDSSIANFPSNLKNNNYRGNGQDGEYVKGQQDDDDFEPVVLLGKYLDLALRKSITKIDDVAPSVNRLPRVDASKLIPNGTETTAKYNHPKNDLEVNTNQFIEYTLTVYNEGEKDGYAAQIKDYLPAGIEFVELVAPLDKYTASSVKNADGTSVVTITNTKKTVLGKYTGGTPKNEAVTIKCKVTAKATTEDQRLVNIAEITKYFDSELGSEITQDRDSSIANFPSNLKNNNYRGNGQDGEYVKGQQDDDDFEPVILPGKEFDLSLRKFISKVNNKELGTSREPVVDVSKLIPNGTEKTAIYNHTKAPLQVKIGDIVTYTIRVYNEGELAGYANEITDHLPQYLEFLPEDEENIANGWVYDENDTTLRTIKTNHLSKQIDEDNIIKEFDGKTLSYKDVTIRCRVKANVNSGDKITNIADITDFTDPYGQPVEDRDSEKDNVILQTDEELPNYKDEEIEKGDKYIPGQEDDDDFEKLIIQKFDLALRKFITAVNNKSVTTRIPVPTMGEDGNIKYNHTKEPVEVQTNNIVTYTLRIFNEGDISGYASEITDNLPEGLLYLPENELNKTYRWKMIDKDGNETQDVEKAVKVTTDYLSIEQEKTAGENLIKAYNKELGITNGNPDYKDIKIAFKVIEPNTSDRILTNIAEISDDQDEYGDPVEDDDSTPGNNDMTEDDIDVEHVKLTYFDLALRKFITKIDNLDVNNRYPKLEMGEDGNIKYVHTKEPIEVENGNIVTYTIRVYNEGKMDGYASEITDDLPKGLLYLPENETNKSYEWKMIDKDGKETNEVEKAVKITTDHLSIAKEKTAGENLIKAYDKELGITDKNPDYRDVLIAFKVTEPETSDRILINTAEISEDTNSEGDPVDDIDSTPDNNDPDEDDIDIEKVKVKYFDLALKKWVSKAILIEDGKTTVTDTGHTGDENPEPVVKVDLKDKKLNKVTVKFEYKIKVTNEGQIAGYATEIKDHIPDGLVFEKEDNPDWEVFDEGIVVTDKLKDTLLRPGESAEVTIILTWVNSQDNLGLKVNIAEISKDKNDSDTPDIDSTPDNFVPEEDDQDDAPVILSVKTGEIRFYITLTAIVLVTLAGGVILIKKYVL